VLDGVRHGQFLADRGQPFRRETAAQLQREQWIPERGVDNSAQELPRQAQLEPFREHPPRRAETERPHLQPLDGCEGALERDGSTGPPGKDERHRTRVEAPGGECEGVSGGSVQPLKVVDGNEQRAVGRERAQRIPKAERDRSAIGRRVSGLGPEERQLQRSQLRSGQAVEAAQVHIVEQVDQAGKRQLRLGPARSGRQDAYSAPAGDVDRGLPQRRLPDPRLAREHERPRRAGPVEKVVHLGELRGSPDGPARVASRCGHAPPGPSMLRGRTGLAYVTAPV
jgi:hypothetical protein